MERKGQVMFAERYPRGVWQDTKALGIDPDDTYEHGIESDEDMEEKAERYTIRVPLLNVDDIGFSDSAALVTANSPEHVLAAVHQLALYFRREMRFDFPQFFDPTEATDEAFRRQPWEAWLIPGSPRVDSIRPLVFGAGVFHQYESGWCLDWVWVHPFLRGKGVLRSAWREWTDRYGDFQLSKPISPAMPKFVARQRQQPE